MKFPIKLITLFFFVFTVSGFVAFQAGWLGGNGSGQNQSELQLSDSIKIEGKWYKPDTLSYDERMSQKIVMSSSKSFTAIDNSRILFKLDSATRKLFKKKSSNDRPPQSGGSR